MDFDGGDTMMGFGLLFIFLLVSLVAYALGWRPQSTNSQKPIDSQPTPLDVLKERYARGEIGQNEYHKMCQELLN